MRERVRDGGSWPSHLCSVSCHYVLWGSAKTQTPRFHSSSSYTRDFNTHTSPRAQRGGAASRVPNRAKFSVCKRSAAAPTDAAEPPLLPLTWPPYCLLQPQAFRREWEVFVGKKNTTWPTCPLKGGWGETLPVVRATKKKKVLREKRALGCSAAAALEKSLGS